jgi:hypothetical protein
MQWTLHDSFYICVLFYLNSVPEQTYVELGK